MAHALRAGVSAGIIQAILVVARQNKNNMPADDLSRQYQQQVDLMLRKAEREEERIQIFNQQMSNLGLTFHEIEQLGQGGAIDFGDEMLAELHQVLAEWL